MKISKILAAGIAATLAVTSLASVVSAEEKTFPMGTSVASFSNTTSNGTYNVAYLANVDDATGAIVQNAKLAAFTGTATITYPVSVVDEAAGYKLKGVTLKVTGINGLKNTTTSTASYAFDENKDPAGNVVSYSLTVGTAGYSFNPSQYVEITGLEIGFKVEHNDIYSEDTYNKICSDYGEWVDFDCDKVTTTPAMYGGGGSFAEDLVTFAGTAGTKYGTWLGNNGSGTIKDEYAWLPETWTKDTEDGRYIERNNVLVLSQTRADGTQQNVDNHAAQGFEGLASQVASFFNHKDNTKDTITFKFVPKSKSESGWSYGGVWNTQVGLKQSLADTGFALFLNYMATTGDLQCNGVVDAAACTVTFDITKALEELSYQTIGTIQDIYYAMNNGIEYEKGKARGYWVESVVLAYEANEAADADVDDEDDAPVADDEDDAQIDDVDDADDYDDADDDEDDAVVDDTADDGEVAADIVVVTPADDDANPGTGVALAIVPAILAGAAVVISRKRK